MKIKKIYKCIYTCIWWAVYVLGEIWGKEYNWSLKILGKPINHKLFLNETIKALASLQRWRTIEVFAKVNTNTYFI